MNHRPLLMFPLALIGATLPGADLQAQEPELTVTIKALEAQMKYDIPKFEAKPGTRIKIVFENLDGMPHNLVVCKPADDKGMEVAQAAWALGDQGIPKNWIPAHPRVIAHTGMVQPHQREEMVFTLPAEPGTYPYVCTFPGHAQLMNGLIEAKSEGSGLTNLTFDYFVGNWDRLPDYKTLKPEKTGPAKDNKMDVARDSFVDAKNYYGLVYRGELEAPKDGDYQFMLTSDDGSRIVIDEKTVVSYDGIHPAGDIKVGKTRLTKGKHAFRLEYFEAAGEEMLYAGWKGPGFSETAFTTWVPENRKPGGAEHNQTAGLLLEPENGEAVIHRNFIEGASPRGIAVGYPGGLNLVWDANFASLPLLWRGAFLDVKRHWSDRGGGNIPPLGYDKVKVADGVSIARLATDDATWPAAEGKRDKELDYRGYRLDKRRFPTFSWKHAGSGVAVEESFDVSGNFAPGGNLKAVRTLAVTGSGDRLFLRAATGASAEEKDGWIVIDGQYRVQAANARVRASGNRREVLVPVTLNDGKATVSVTYAWLD